MISFITANWNTKELTSNCLRSLFAYHKDLEKEVIVIDNGSKDGSLELIKNRFPMVKLISNTKNLGFAHAINQGIKQSKGEYIVLLNSDTYFIDNGLKNILAISERYKNKAVIGCKVLNPDFSLQKTAFGNFPTLHRLFLQALWLDRVPFVRKLFKTFIYKKEEDVPSPLEMEADWISGAFMFIPREIYNSVSGLDERYFMYLEDIDWCHRAKKLGYKVIYTDTVRIVHLESKSFSKNERRYGPITKSGRSMLLLYKKFYPKKLRALELIMLLESIVKITGGFFLCLLPSKRNRGKEYIKAFFSNLKLVFSEAYRARSKNG